MESLLVDYHTHPIAHGSGSYEFEYLRQFLNTAKKRGVSFLGFADHDMYLEQIDFSTKEKLQKEFPHIQLSYGIEVDYFPHQEAEIGNMLTKYPFDFAIGSVHAIDDFPFDMEEYLEKYKEWDIDALYSKYYSMVEAGAKSNLFQIMGHLDLIKVFGYRPKKKVIAPLEATLQGIVDHKLTVEINTNGFFKPIGEIYPEEQIIERCFALNIPLTISSDAHLPEDVGRMGREALSLIKGIGYRQIATFKNKKRIMLNL